MIRMLKNKFPAFFKNFLYVIFPLNNYRVINKKQGIALLCWGLSGWVLKHLLALKSWTRNQLKKLNKIKFVPSRKKKIK